MSFWKTGSFDQGIQRGKIDSASRKQGDKDEGSHHLDSGSYHAPPTANVFHHRASFEHKKQSSHTDQSVQSLHGSFSFPGGESAPSQNSFSKLVALPTFAVERSPLATLTRRRPLDPVFKGGAEASFPSLHLDDEQDGNEKPHTPQEATEVLVFDPSESLRSLSGEGADVDIHYRMSSEFDVPGASSNKDESDSQASIDLNDLMQDNDGHDQVQTSNTDDGGKDQTPLESNLINSASNPQEEENDVNPEEDFIEIDPLPDSSQSSTSEYDADEQDQDPDSTSSSLADAGNLIGESDNGPIAFNHGDNFDEEVDDRNVVDVNSVEEDETSANALNENPSGPENPPVDTNEPVVESLGDANESNVSESVADENNAANDIANDPAYFLVAPHPVEDPEIIDSQQAEDFNDITDTSKEEDKEVETEETDQGLMEMYYPDEAQYHKKIDVKKTLFQASTDSDTVDENKPSREKPIDGQNKSPLNNPSRFTFLSDKSEVPSDIQKIQERAIQRRRDLQSRLHLLECRLAQVTANYTEEKMDLDLAISDTMDRSVCRPLMESADRLTLERESSVDRTQAVVSLGHRLTVLDTLMTRHIHVTLHNARRDELGSLHDQLIDDVIPGVRIENFKCDKIEGGIIRRFESAAGTITRRFHEESASRRAALEVTRDKIRKADQRKRIDDVKTLKAIEELRAKIRRERAQRQAADKKLLDEIVETTAAMKRALLEAVGGTI